MEEESKIERVNVSFIKKVSETSFVECDPNGNTKDSAWQGKVTDHHEFANANGGEYVTQKSAEWSNSRNGVMGFPYEEFEKAEIGEILKLEA